MLDVLEKLALAAGKRLGPLGRFVGIHCFISPALFGVGSSGRHTCRDHGRRWRVGMLALHSVPAALVTLYVISGFDRDSMSFKSVLTQSLGWMLFLSAILVIFRTPIVDKVAEWRRHHPPVAPRRIVIATAILGLLLGVLVTLTSVGAGALGVTALLMLHPRLEIRDVVGSDIIHAVPLTLVGGLGYRMIGEIYWAMLLSLLIGSVPGIILGSHLAPRMPDRLIRPILAITLALVALKLVTS